MGRTINTSTGHVEPADERVMSSVGVQVEGHDRSGTYILRDSRPQCVLSRDNGLELLPIADALQKYDWLRERYYWKAVPADLDEYTSQCAAEEEPQGYFVHVKKGAKLSSPVQACLYITQGDLTQTVHNIVILEEDAELHLITGCATRTDIRSAIHLGVSEHYIGRNARLTGTMVHSWGPDVEVRPRSGTVVETDGTFVSNYVSLRPAGSIQSRPSTWLNGEGASAKYLRLFQKPGGVNRRHRTDRLPRPGRALEAADSLPNAAHSADFSVR